MTRASLLSASCALALIGAGCASPPKPENVNLTTQADQHKIDVAEMSQELSFAVSPEDAALSREASMEIEAFARMYVRQGHGPVYLATPSGGANANAAARLAQEARMKLASLGVPYAAITGSTYDASGQADAPIRLNYLRYEATAPKCAPLYEQNLAFNPSNRPWESFGCAQKANLAAMISDPRDLQGPRAEDPRDAGRRANVLDAYRKGEQSHAERTDDERVQVSKAVE